MKSNKHILLIVVSAGLLPVGCQAGSNTDTTASGGSSSTSGATTTTVTDATASVTTGGFMTNATGTGGAMPTCNPGGPDDDVDQDGFTQNQGDCDDCDKNRNPNAIEVATPPGKEAFDEDCDGETDEDDSVLCDDMLALDSNDPMDAARAMELCKISSGPQDWGVVNSKWVLADGTPPPADPATHAKYDLGHGMLPKFGANVVVRKGVKMLGLSSGTARQPTDPGYQDAGSADKGFTCAHPFGFPKESPACPGDITGEPHDAAAVELDILTPSNATGIQFDFDFFTYEWPGYVCSTFNDFFVALLTPFPAGQLDGNITFDSQGNPISVNNALLEVCGCPGNPPNPCSAGGKTFNCSLGDTDLIQTGFGFDTAFGQDHGSTGWLRTTAPVEGGETINLRFAVYDSGDGVLATTTLVDNFQWVAAPGIKVGTNPVPQ